MKKVTYEENSTTPIRYRTISFTSLDDFLKNFYYLHVFIKTNFRFPFKNEEYEESKFGEPDYMLFPVGEWWTEIKQKQRKNTLNYNCIKLVNALAKHHGLTMYWEGSDWDDNLEILLKYIFNTNLLPLIDSKFKNEGIGRWWHSQIGKYKRNELTQEQINKLTAISLCNEYFQSINRDNCKIASV